MSYRSIVFLMLTLGLASCRPPDVVPEESSESVFFLVRHAEKLDDSEDPPLSEVGHRRARALASLLRDARIGAITSSDFIRCRDTVRPLTEKLGVEALLYDRDNLRELAEKLLSTPGRYLVVGHSDTTPDLVRLLGGEPGTDIADDEYDRLYLLVHRAGIGTTTTLIRFESP